MMHLAATYIFAVPQEDRPARMREISACVERAYAAGCNDVNEPVDSDSALAFVVSYPRSGNTVLIQTLADLLQAQIFEGFPHSLIPFSKKLYPKHYPLCAW